ncbi:unnamed protein product [Amoebophrya sp. A25]|nr:unnamed protein product [Amoebophrya sp. A25]|eukprot:GSA25T00020622001.1
MSDKGAGKGGKMASFYNLKSTAGPKDDAYTIAYMDDDGAEREALPSYLQSGASRGSAAEASAGSQQGAAGEERVSGAVEERASSASTSDRKSGSKKDDRPSKSSSSKKEGRGCCCPC